MLINVFKNSKNILRIFNKLPKFSFRNLSTNLDLNHMIKERIRIVDVDEVGIDTSENWTEQIVFRLEKENFQNFPESIKYLSDKNIILNVNEINKILSLIFNKNNKSIDILKEYINEKNITLDSISFHYLILSALKFKSFNDAYDLFVESSITGISQNLSVITALLKALSKMGSDDIAKYKGFIVAHYEKYYTKDDIE
jgi:hypothetical protein